MPRKTVGPALRDYLQADYNRWRLLARNGLFRKNLCEFLNKCGTALYRGEGLSVEETNRRWEKMQQLRGVYLEKWKIDTLPDVDLWPENEEPLLTVESLERWYQAARKENNEFATVDYPAFMTKIRRGSHLDRMFVEFSLDFRLPIDNLIAFVERELRSYYDKYYWKTYLLRTGQNRGKPPSLDFHLNVYDFMMTRTRGTKPTFTEASRKFRRPASSVRDAFFAACSKIDPEAFSRQMSKVPDVAREQPANPGPPSECSDMKCRNAETIEEFCFLHKSFYLQDEVSQSDLMVKDLSELEYGLIRKASGRKHRKPYLSSDD